MAETAKKKYDTLAAAMIAFQAKLPSVTKSATADTGKFSYNYAPLEKISPVILSALTDVGIAYIAAPHLNELDQFVLRAKLVHESGQEFGGDYPLGNPNAPAQAIGSAVTYARRYALLSLTGVAPEGEDDDGMEGAKAAGSTRPAKVETPKDDKETLRERISTLISDPQHPSVTGEKANEILEKLSGTNVPAKWTVTHFKKALAELENLS